MATVNKSASRTLDGPFDKVLSLISHIRNFIYFNMPFVKFTGRMQDRSDYKSTWQWLSWSHGTAKKWVAGYTNEEELERTGKHTVEVLERYVGINPDDEILEIGCGVGRVGKILSAKCKRWIGSDISVNMLDYAARRLKGIDNIELLELQDVGLEEFEDNSLDLIYSTVVFMHLFEWDRFRYVEESFRVLKPGGRCFFDNVDITSDHGKEFFQESYSYKRGKRPAHIGMVSSGDELESYAKWAGFTDIKIHRWDNAWVAVSGVKPA